MAADDTRGVILTVKTTQQSFTLGRHYFPDLQQFERILETVSIGHAKDLAICSLAQKSLHLPPVVYNVTDCKVTTPSYYGIVFTHMYICVKVNAFLHSKRRDTPDSGAKVTTRDSRTAGTAGRSCLTPYALRHQAEPAIALRIWRIWYQHRHWASRNFCIFSCLYRICCADSRSRIAETVFNSQKYTFFKNYVACYALMSVKRCPFAMSTLAMSLG